MRTKIKVQKLMDVNTPMATATTTAMFTAINHTNGAEFEHTERDDKYLILLSNENGGTMEITIKAGNGAAATEDLVVSIPTASYTAVTIDSAKYKFVSGTNKDKVLIETGSSGEDTKAAVFVLP